MNTNQASQQTSRYLSAAVSAVLSLAAAAAAHAGPQDGIVTRGSATISTPDLNLTQIDQGSHNASINWQSFDVAAQERVIFNQPSASSVALNRILTQDPSQIHGSITANGRVFLINPNGIIFGASSRINVGSLVASSLDIADVDAVTGRYTFNTAAIRSGAISNSGQITAADGGSVTLLGGSVVNNGLIVADYGSVNLGAGRAATLHFDGDGLVRFQIDACLLPDSSGATAAVDNTGEIRADGGQVLLTARAASDVIARAVNNEGVIRAARIENVGGSIRLVGPEGAVVNSGTLDATGVGATSTGGQVQVLGDRVELPGTALIDVSGSAGGGTALIGGSFAGADPAVLNAQQTDVQAGAVIRADATSSGDAGQVAVWADGTTTFHGDIFARAAGSAGNGGYAEVSGREHLRIGGHAWLESVNGAAGMLLLDPGAITIRNGPNNAPTGTLDTINDGWVIGQLAGSNVIIETNSSNANNVEDLTVEGPADIIWANTNSLTLRGDASVSLEAGSSIQNTGSGALILESAGAVSIGGTVTLAGDLTVTAGADITQAAALSIGGASSFTTGVGQSVVLNNAGNSFAGAVSFAAGGPGNLLNVTVNDSTALDLQALTLSGNLTVTSGGAITQSGALVIGNIASFTAAAGESIVLNSAGNTFTGAVSLAGSGGNLQDVTLQDATALDLQALTIDGNLTVTAGALTQSGALIVAGASSFTAAPAQSVVLNNAGNAFGGVVSVAAGGGNLQDVTLRDSTALGLQAMTITGNLTVTSGASITQTGALSVLGVSSFTAAAGQSIVLNDAGNVFTGAVSLASGGPGNLLNVTMRDSTALDLQALAIAGDLNINAAAISQLGALSVGGASSFTAGAGQSITLSNAGNALTGAVSFASSGAGNLQDVTLQNTAALDLQGLTLNGNLSATAAGAITQSGALIVGGVSSFTAATGQSVALNNSGNAFTGAVGFAASGGGNLQNVTLQDATALNLQTLTIDGNLTVVSGGSITQSGALDVGAASSFTAAAGQSVVLNDTGNVFTGAVSFISTGPGNLQNVTVRDSTALDLQALTLDGDLNITAGGAISQSGSLSVAGAASFRTLNDAGAAIALNGTNSFGSIQAAVRNAADTLNAAANVVIQENDDTVLGDVQTGSGQSVSITSAGAIAALANTDVSAGSVSLVAAGDIGSAATRIALVAPNGSINAISSGNVYLANTSGIGSTVALDQIVAGHTGTIDLTSDGDIRVADVRAGNSIALTSTNGSILDDGIDGAGSQLVTGNLTLQAAGSIGQASGVGNGTLDLQAGSLSATAQGGAIYVDETDGDLNIRQISAAGPVWLQAGGGSIVDDPADAAAASIASSSGGVQLGALNNIGTVTDVRTRQGTPIAINTNGGALSARVASATGQINLAIASGSNPTAAAAAISAGGAGRLLLQSAGDLSLDSFSSAISGFTEAGFSSDATLSLREQQSELITGSLTTLLFHGGNDIVQTDRVFDLSATHLIFESGAQGGGVTLNTSVDLLDAAVGNGASLTVVEGLGNITLGTISAGGDVSIRAANIFDDGDLNGLTRVAAGNALSLVASAGIGREEGASGGRIDTSGNSASVLADAGPVFISHLGNLQLSGDARGGLMDVAAPTGSITVNGVLHATGPLTLAAGTDAAGATPAVAGDITLSGAVQTEDTAVLSARGGGVIADADDATTHLSARDTNLTATRIGAESNRVNIDVAALSASAPGGIYLSVANAVQLRTLSAQNVVINAAGNITDDGDAQTRITAGNLTLSGSAIGAAGAGNEIATSVDTLSATAVAGGIYISEQGDIELAAVNASGAGNDVVISASGAMTDDGDSATRVSGGNLTLAAASIGAVSANGEIDTQATTLTATASSGGIFIGEADDVQLNVITAGAGSDVSVSAAGALTDDGNSATRVTGANVTLTGSRIGTADSRVDTAAAVLSATATNGGIYIDELDDLTLADVRSSGTGNTVDLRTGNNGNVIVQNLTTQGGAVNLAAGGTGSLNVTGAIASNNGVVNLTAGNALAVPGLSTGTGSVVLHTVNDLNVGTVTAGSISITSDTGNISLGTVNAGAGTASITANNGTITDGTATSLTAGQATLSARSIGSQGNSLNVAVGTLTANSSAGGIFIDDIGGLTVSGVSAAGLVNLATSGALIQASGMTSAGNAISLFADSIDMQASTTTISQGGDITYVANDGDITLAVLDAAGGRALVIAADNVYSALGSTSATNNLTASAVEVRAGGLGGGAGEIGTVSSPLAIATPVGAGRSVYLIVPTLNGIQTSTPRINYAGPTSSLLLKGHSGSSGALLFDQSSTFTPDTVLRNGESIVPLLNGRIAVNSDSLGAAKQALSSGVVSRVNVDWAAFDPNVSLFGTLDPALRLPADQIDEAGPAANLIPQGTTLVVTRDGWKLVPALQQISMVR